MYYNLTSLHIQSRYNEERNECGDKQLQLLLVAKGCKDKNAIIECVCVIIFLFS